MISQFQSKRSKYSFRMPHKLCPTEWEIKGKMCPEDKRVQELLTISYGNISENSSSVLCDVSLKIGNQVVILDPLNQHALIKLLLDATEREGQKAKS